MKMPKFRTKNALFGYFGARIFQISTLECFKNEFFTHTVNIEIRSTFSKDPRFAFEPEGPSPGLGLLCKICHRREDEKNIEQTWATSGREDN